MPKVAFTSVGCKLNRYEIQLMSERLATHGFQTVPFSQPADCYVVNTCTVTSDADLSSRQLIRRARRRSPGAKIVVTGCYAQLRPEVIAELKIDQIISNRDKDRVPEAILGLFGIASAEPSDHDSDPIISGMDGMTRAFVKIQDGCDEQCAFCAIWTARGPVKSRPIRSVIREINALSINNFKEIVLTGVHIGKYVSEDLDLEGLLIRLLAETSIERIRLSSLNPTEISDEMVRILASNSRLCPHVHLSVQSGDDEVLRAMGRKYSRQNITRAVMKLTDAIPEITIGADFIVGFPGETEDDFDNTFRLIDQTAFHHLHVFPYSDRPGTRAESLGGKIPHEIKERRAQKLRLLGDEKKLKHLNRFIGMPLRVLVENRVTGKETKLTGLSENYLRVNISGPEQLKGNIIRVIPESIADGKLTAVVKINALPAKRS